MAELAHLATVLQHGDSFFPSGSVAFSWGLESLVTDGKVRTANDVAELIAGQLDHRWGPCDRAVLAATYQAGDDLGSVQVADQLQEAMTLAKELREGSQRSGAALLGVHAKLGTPNSGAYRALVRTRQAPGHLTAIQGLVWRGVGLTLEQACVIAAHSTCVGLLSAAVRLNVIGHLDSQRILGALQPMIAQILTSPPPDLRHVYTYTPALDIAAMRHEVQLNRLFSN